MGSQLISPIVQLAISDHVRAGADCGRLWCAPGLRFNQFMKQGVAWIIHVCVVPTVEKSLAFLFRDEAKPGNYFYRFVLSPDPKAEDTAKDLLLRNITEQTMLSLEQQLQQQIAWVAAVHADHAPHRHMHVVAVVPGRLQVQDFQAMRTEATEAALAQRKQRDLAREHQERMQEGAQWER